MSSQLNLLCREYSGFVNALKKQAEKFTEINPDIKIEIKTIEEYERLNEEMIKSSLTSNYDIFLCLTDIVPQLLKNRSLVPLNKYIKEDPPEDWPNTYDKALLRIQTDKDGYIYGFPYHDGPVMFYYRKDLFEEKKNKEEFKRKYGKALKPPKTWSEFLNIAQFFTKREEGFYGAVVGAKPDGHNNIYDFMINLWTRGGSFFDDKMKPIFNSKEGVEALQFYSDLIRKYRVVPEESVKFSAIDAGEFYYKEGKASMTWNWTHVAAMAEIPKYSSIVGKTGYSLIPKGDLKGQHISLSVYWILGITSGSKNKDEAYKFLRFVTKHEMDKITAYEGNIATRLSVWREPEILKRWPFYSMIEKIHKNVGNLPPIPEYPEINKVLNEAIEEVVIEGKDVKETLDKAREEVYKIMERAGYYG
ncbi:MAG: sugar ABC transporter substrate-binding protein [Nitrososphaerales archaeon]